MLGRRCGPFEVVGELARGGQGVVLRARHAATGAPAALKLLLKPTDRGLRRFKQEVAVLERIQHPNLVRVLAHGEDGATPWVAMELVEGESLRQRLDARGPLPAPEAAAVLAAVARAVQACHDLGVVHRDIKPENIILERTSGRPVLVDLGMARRDREQFGELSIDDRSRLSRTGELRGTPAYMAPEQVAPERWGEVSPLTDVHALGTTLFVALTGAQPVEADSLPGLFHAILEHPPRDPRDLAPGVPASLARACLRARARAQAERQPSAEAFAAALEGAGPERRRWPLLLALAAVVLSAGAGAALATTRRPAPPTPAGGATSTPETTSAPPAPAIDLPPSAAPIARSPGGSLRLRRVHGAYDDLHVDHIWSLAFSPDERRLLSGTGFWTHTSPGVVELRAIDAGAELRAWRAHAGTVSGVAFSQDGRRGVTAGRDGEVRLWDLGDGVAPGGPPLSRLAGPAVVSLCPLAADRWLVVRTDGQLQTVRLLGDTLEVVGQRQVVGPVTLGAALAGGGRAVLDGAPPVLLDLESGEPWPLANKRLHLVAAAADPDGQLLFAASEDGTFRLFDLLAYESRGFTPRTRGEATSAAAWIPGARQVLRGRADGKVAVLDVVTGEDVRAWDVATNLYGVAAVAVTRDGRRAAVGAGDGRLRLVDLADPGRAPAIRDLGPPPAPGALPGRVERLAPAGERLLVGHFGGRVDGTPVATLLDLRTGARASLATGVNLVRAVGVAGDLALVAGEQAGPVVQVWDLARPSAAPRRLAPALRGHLFSAALSPDGRTVVACSDEGDAWAGPTDGGPGRALRAADRPLQDVVFAPGGAAALGLASVWNEELTVLLRWELATGDAREVRVPASTTTLALVGDDVLLGGQRGQVERWSLKDGARVLAYPSHEGAVLALAVSEDRTRVASAGNDGRVRLADARSGAALDALDLGLTGDRAHALAFVGTRLLVGTARGLVLELEGP